MADTNSLLLTLCFLFMVALCTDESHLKMSLIYGPKKNFTEARRICRQHYVDLVTLDIGRRLMLTEGMWINEVNRVWIGEHRNQRNSSVWKAIDLRDADEMWTPDHPDDEVCAIFQRNKEKLNNTACSRKFPFFCLSDNLVLVKENKTWEDAQQHCEDLEAHCELKQGGSCKHSLLTFPQQSDYDYVRDRISYAETDEVWTGLRFLGGHWFGMDGQGLRDEGALPHCPYEQEHCGTFSKYDTNNWITRDCSEKRNFICAKSSPSHSTLLASKNKRQDVSTEGYK